MKDTAHTFNMRIQFDARHCRLRQGEVDKMMANLVGLGEQVKHFPISDLHILIEHTARTNEFSVKTSLLLTGETLVSTDHDQAIHPAFERCVDNLTENVRAYKDRLGNVPEWHKQEKGTHQEIQTDVVPNAAILDETVAAEDYARFRLATLAYEEPLRKRIGRWIERYPEVEAQIDRKFKMADLVEEVFLQAFEAYPKRPPDVRFGEWLEELIDPSVKALMREGDDELENVRMAQVAVAAEGGPEAVN